MEIICGITEKPCEFWDEECLAIYPEQCPYNTKDDAEVIKQSQRDSIERAGGENGK